MRHPPELFAPSHLFWRHAAQAVLRAERRLKLAPGTRDYSGIRVIVPTFEHILLFQRALAREISGDSAGNFIPPRVNTLFGWLELQLPEAGVRTPSGSERLMDLYAALRQHAWLKKLFSARSNTDLLPLAQTLLSLADELTAALLPAVQGEAQDLQQRWHAALAHLPPPAQKLLSDEAQLVWTIWQSQLDANDALVQRQRQLMRLTRQASEPLVWIGPTAPESTEDAFLSAYAKKQPVLPLLLDWRDASLPQPYAGAWPFMVEAQPGQALQFSIEHADTDHLRLCEAASLEDEAVQGAQTIVDWLLQGKENIAVVAQDRVVARRIRALLERADVHVADETGWKLSTTRASAALAAWLEVVATQADTVALLDLLKAPYLRPGDAAKADQVMQIELALRKANVAGGWESILAALAGRSELQEIIKSLQRRAAAFAGRRTLADWAGASLETLQQLDMREGLMADPAGAQAVQLLQQVQLDCASMDIQFSFAEWRVFLSMQLESTPFIVSRPDRRVVMLPLNGARLRNFDAVLLVGADASHLPSQPQEVLFFTNAVRRECGLATREALQRQQLRDFAELLLVNPEVVLSWQGQADGEHNPVSPWIEQLALSLERAGRPPLLRGQLTLPAQHLHATAPVQPRPSAPQLTPPTLSASGYASLVACPYQFFAGRMLGLDAMEALSDLPEKRDYGDWLHAILKQYHENLRERPVAAADREALLRDISRRHFDPILQHSPAALGYMTRWIKAIPAYVAWANAREDAGWKFVMGESWSERTLAWPGGEVTLRGRIDRLDRDADGELAVLDYKTRTATALAKRLKQGEDQQLPFYGLLAGEAAGASYVALEVERGKTGAVDAQDYTEWTEALEHAIKDNMAAIKRGAELPAQGVQSVCQYCDMRGLCRKGAW